MELTTYYHVSVHCPFCGQKVVDIEAADAGGDINNACPHTLFVAHDEGFDFRSPRFDEAMAIVGIGDDDVRESDHFDNMDAFTDLCVLPDAVKFAAYVGPPSGFGSYVGFAPVEG